MTSKVSDMFKGIIVDGKVVRIIAPDGTVFEGSDEQDCIWQTQRDYQLTLVDVTACGSNTKEYMPRSAGLPNQ